MGVSRQRPPTYDPRLARRRAVETLFEADVRRENPADTVERQGDEPLDAYARRLIEGVGLHIEQLDETIGSLSHGWSVPRMPVIDRNILRLAAYELLHEQTPPAVVIDEAVELAKLLSTSESPRFVNGVLEALRSQLDLPAE